MNKLDHILTRVFLILFIKCYLHHMVIIEMGFQTSFQQKNNYRTIEKRLIRIIDKENTQNSQNHKIYTTPSSNLTIENYNNLLDTLNRKYLK